jgi:DeoR family transcriptional regulator, suf operon transcriptional repressor
VLHSDKAILDLLRKRDALTVSELADSLQVTATAVRQRLTRLLAHGMIRRKATKEGRGRPSHYYSLTDKGQRKTGSNFADLAMALWQEVRAIKDPEIRRGLLQRISGRLVEIYRPRMGNQTREERMEAVVELFRDRQVPFEVDRSNPQLPVLTALACPYPELAEQDRSICSLERMMFSELVGENLRLSSCRLDGEKCCSFEPTRGQVTGEPATV